ncbi:MAG: hypothetical protein JWP97_1311 [Labilithrix sp.]|nr:hypothetical protein [Labilithrix sp.]
MKASPLRALLTAGLTGGLALLASCNTFDLPAETCDPGRLDARRDPGNEDNGCTACLEDNCCDYVGRCQNENGCPALVHDAQRCVLDARLQGARSEATCAEPLASVKEADEAYRCMRSACGAQCGLPVCEVDKAALLIHDARCDKCFAGACCQPLNRCYGSRACKLMLECIVSTCGAGLGAALEGSTGTLPEQAPRTRAEIDTLCATPPSGSGALPACVQSCLCLYRDNDQGLPQPDITLLPVNLAESVYRCGKEAECGPDCSAAAGDAAAP